VAVSEEESLGTTHDGLKKEAKVTNDGSYGDFSFDKFAHLLMMKVIMPMHLHLCISLIQIGY